MRFVLECPAGERAIVVLAHGCGRFRPGGAVLARALAEARLATLDILTAEPESDAIVDAIDWLPFDAVIGELPRDVGEQPVGCFGDGVAAASALIAAAERRGRVGAVVCAVGRPDLAADALPRVVAPTLLIAEADDAAGLEANREAQAAVSGEVRLETVPGARRALDEPAARERVAALTRDWFLRHLDPAR